jgi:hypothetical protein
VPERGFSGSFQNRTLRTETGSCIARRSREKHLEQGFYGFERLFPPETVPSSLDYV